MEFGREIFAYQVDTEAGERVVLSLMDAEITFTHGLRAEAILGMVREGVDPDRLAPDDFQERPLGAPPARRLRGPAGGQWRLSRQNSPTSRGPNWRAWTSWPNGSILGRTFQGGEAISTG